MHFIRGVNKVQRLPEKKRKRKPPVGDFNAEKVESLMTSLQSQHNLAGTLHATPGHRSEHLRTVSSGVTVFFSIRNQVEVTQTGHCGDYVNDTRS